MIYDIIGIGIGPFNLGLAALTENIAELSCLFFDENKEFNWHPGLMLDEARMQVPFYADLVTLADPTNPYSYMAFLKQKQRIFRFAITENNFITRKEYNEYATWVADSIRNCRFGFRCEAITYDEMLKAYRVGVKESGSTFVTFYYAKHIVIGVGTVPAYPSCWSPDGIEEKNPFIQHSSNYLFAKESLLSKKSISVIGSGQSAAEVFHDLLQYQEHFTSGLHWLTSSPRFLPMENSKFSWEMTSPDYIEHFYSLPVMEKEFLQREQKVLYKGINQSLISAIYDQLYLQSLSAKQSPKIIASNTSLKKIEPKTNGDFNLTFHHKALNKEYSLNTEAVILATGYKYKTPSFIYPVKELINWLPGNKYNVAFNYSIDARQTIFVQNAELHTHGFNAADLGMGPYRNAIILNAILGCEYFKMEKNIAFQSFGIPALAEIIT